VNEGKNVEKKTIKKTSFEEMFRPDIHVTIINVDKLDMSPEKFERMKQRSALASLKLRMQDPNTMSRHTDM
jgi:hypothetical protein